ncbi:MAG: sigma-70 family RNA polymerase sigma factor, partial [Planctomycetaceae bacterium]|nr:sigma-70 family RNA polymerase sigma factor [Planctomycetaceae bacterium]
QEQLVKDKSSLMPSRMLASDELQKVVRAALDELGERQRMALLLHRFEGMSYADVGEAMELSTSAVKSLLSRARDSLRSRLESYVRQQ